jgi:transposase
MGRRIFTREFKLAAVNKVVKLGLSCAEVARDLGVKDSLIYNWRKAFQADGTLEVKKADELSVDSELQRLRAEVRQLKIDREILKKATAFFAKENG